MVVSFNQNQPGCDAATFVRHLDSIYIDPNVVERFESTSGDEAG